VLALPKEKDREIARLRERLKQYEHQAASGSPSCKRGSGRSSPDGRSESRSMRRL